MGLTRLIQQQAHDLVAEEICLLLMDHVASRYTISGSIAPSSMLQSAKANIYCTPC
jgi:hypothetical protein